MDLSLLLLYRVKYKKATTILRFETNCRNNMTISSKKAGLPVEKVPCGILLTYLKCFKICKQFADLGSNLRYNKATLGNKLMPNVVVNVVKKFPSLRPSVSLEMKKSLKTNGFQGFNVVEISGIELLTS